MTLSRIEALPATWAIVPAKPLVQAKTRLSSVLSPVQRHSLQSAMLADVLGVLSAARLIEGVAIVTSDPEVAQIADTVGAMIVEEIPADAGLNHAIASGSIWLASQGCSRAVVVPADLPFLSVVEVDAALTLARQADVNVVLPDRDGSGTNGLVFHTAAPPDFRFGTDSFHQHVAQQPAGRKSVAVSLPSFALDVDVPADLAEAFKRLDAADPPGLQTRSWMLRHRPQLEEQKYG